MRFFLILSIIILFLLQGCDPSSTYRKVVANNSNYDLVILSYPLVNGTYGAQPKTSVSIKPNENTVIYDASGMGVGNPSCVGRGAIFGDSLGVEINNSTNLKVSTDLNNESTWTRKSSGNSAKGYIVECRATITDADIVPK
jgi:hypothetical protein